LIAPSVFSNIYLYMHITFVLLMTMLLKMYMHTYQNIFFFNFLRQYNTPRSIPTSLCCFPILRAVKEKSLSLLLHRFYMSFVCADKTFFEVRRSMMNLIVHGEGTVTSHNDIYQNIFFFNFLRQYNLILQLF
jgi:hypothetical protein